MRGLDPRMTVVITMRALIERYGCSMPSAFSMR